MTSSSAQRGREVVEDYTLDRWAPDEVDIDAVVSLVRDVLLYVEDEYGSDMVEYVLDSAGERL